jgi:hypothetical protein
MIIKRKVKGYWTNEICENCIEGNNVIIPVGFKPKGIIKSFGGKSYIDVHNKLWKWNPIFCKYYIYIEKE